MEVDIDTKSVKYVYFDNSNIETFRSEFMEQLRGIEELNANGIGLKNISWNTLSILEGLVAFWCGENNIEMLEANTFSNNPSLEIIYLKFNLINFIHPNAFDKLYQLIYLDLSSNKLKDIECIFDSLYNLAKLDLSSNSIERFDKEIFRNLENLRELNIQKNNFKFLDPQVFDPLMFIEFIFLSFNKSPLEVIPSRLFQFNIHLRKIYLIQNRIRAIERKFLLNEKPSLELISFRQNSCTDDDILALNGTVARDESLKLKLCYQNFNQIQSELKQIS